MQTEQSRPKCFLLKILNGVDKIRMNKYLIKLNESTWEAGGRYRNKQISEVQGKKLPARTFYLFVFLSYLFSVVQE